MNSSVTLYTQQLFEAINLDLQADNLLKVRSLGVGERLGQLPYEVRDLVALRYKPPLKAHSR